MKKKWWMIVVILALAGAGYGGYALYGRFTAQQNVAAAAEAETETVIVKRGTLRMTVDGGGSLSPDQEVAVSFANGGNVVEILVDIGDEVKAGDVLARLDDTDARQAIE
ncbi:MAG: biotin/lipoyl-binding protein, partial [Anaerolineae bacterium]